MATWRSRYCEGEHPTRSRNRELNDPRLEKPTRKHTSVTVRFAVRRRSFARSIRRRVSYAPGVSPKASRNDRTKWYGEYPATRASSRRSKGSAKRRSIRSRAWRSWTSFSAVATNRTVAKGMAGPRARGAR